MKGFFRALSISVLLTLMLVPLRSQALGLGIDYSTVAGYIAYFIITVLLLSNVNDRSTKAKILAGLFVGSVLLFPNAVPEFFRGNLWFLPQLLLQSVGIMSGYLFSTLKFPVKIIPAAFGCALAILMFTHGFDYWLHYLAYGSFSGKVNAKKIEVKVNGVDQNGNFIDNSSFNGRIVVLDFWNTSCSECFAEFPMLQEFYIRNEKDNSIAIFALNKPLEEDSAGAAFAAISTRGYTFPVLLPSDVELPEKFGVKVYPTTLVLNRFGELVYRGELKRAISVVEDLKEEN